MTGGKAAAQLLPKLLEKQCPRCLAQKEPLHASTVPILSAHQKVGGGALWHRGGHRGSERLNPSAQATEPLRWPFWLLSVLSSCTSQRGKKNAGKALAGVAQFVDHHSVH